MGCDDHPGIFFSYSVEREEEKTAMQAWATEAERPSAPYEISKLHSSQPVRAAGLAR